MNDAKKNIVLRVDPKFHQRVKVYVTMNNTTLQDYIVGLIKKDLEAELAKMNKTTRVVAVNKGTKVSI